MPSWSVGQYLKFAPERTRAAAELLARVPLMTPRKVVDVGCGPGNSTELLVDRFPDAPVIGFDTSEAMLDAARKRLPRVRFELADVAAWSPAGDTDLVFSNAVFQWVPGHLDILARLLEALPPGAVLAVQMPDNKSEPNHVLMRDAAAAIGRRDAVDRAEGQRDGIHSAGMYYDRLAPFTTAVDIWNSTYFHVVDGHAGVVDWLKGTGLRPYLEALDASEEQLFLEAYLERLAAAYPTHANGKVLLRFPRLFLVGTRR